PPQDGEVHERDRQEARDAHRSEDAAALAPSHQPVQSQVGDVDQAHPHGGDDPGVPRPPGPPGHRTPEAAGGESEESQGDPHLGGGPSKAASGTSPSGPPHSTGPSKPAPCSTAPCSTAPCSTAPCSPSREEQLPRACQQH